jgi:single-strand DNA-binding protein
MFNRNRVELIGFLAEAPIIGTTGNGTRFARFRVVTNRSWKDRASGEWRDASEGHSVATFDPFIVDRAAKLTAGAYVLVEGENRNSRRQKQDGSPEYFYGVFIPSRVGIMRVLDRPVRSDQGGVAAGEDRTADDSDPRSSDPHDEIPF